MSLTFSKIYGYIYPKPDADMDAYYAILKDAVSPGEFVENHFTLDSSRFKFDLEHLFPEFKDYSDAANKLPNFTKYVNKLNRNRGYDYRYRGDGHFADILRNSGYTISNTFGKYSYEEPRTNIKNAFSSVAAKNLRFTVLYQNDIACIVSTTSSYRGSFILLREHLHLIGTFKLLDNEFFKRLSGYEIKSLLEGKTLEEVKERALTANVDKFSQLSMNEVAELQSIDEQKVCKMEEEIKRIENFETNELAPLKAELDRMKQELEEKAEAQRALIEQAKQELQEKVKEIQKRIFFLNTDLNSLMYYLGEKLTMVQVREGKFAPKENAIIAYQKLRYIDVEFARYTGANGISWKETDSFEEIIKYRDDILDIFNYANKSISFFKLSETGRSTDYDDKIANMLKSYDIDHADELGFMIRDGENVYIGWMNDEDITLNENVFYSMKDTVVSAADENTRRNDEELKRQNEREELEMSSRYVIFHLMQGLIDLDHPFFRLEGRPNVFQDVMQNNSQYIKFIMTDGWIEDKRFGDYRDVMTKYASMFKEFYPKPMLEEKLLTTQRLTGHSWRGGSNSESYRSNDWRDRVHDVSVSDNTIYPLNYIDESNNVYVSEEKSNSREMYERQQQGDRYYWEDKITRVARANFMLHDSEFVRLTFLNTVLVEYLLNLKHTGYSAHNYTYMAKYYHTMLKYLRQRESVELERIAKYYPEISNVHEWQMILSDWKIEKSVRGEFTDYRAKQFANFLKQQVQFDKLEGE